MHTARYGVVTAALNEPFSDLLNLKRRWEELTPATSEDENEDPENEEPRPDIFLGRGSSKDALVDLTVWTLGHFT